MTLPGFTAEDSLYRTSEQYRTTRAQNQIQGTVYPAQSSRANCISYDPGTLTDCCHPDPYRPDCWNCTTSDSSGYVSKMWDQGDGCSPPPRTCTPSATWNWDENGCKAWYIVHEDCSVETPTTDCPEPITPPNRGTPPPVFLTR